SAEQVVKRRVDQEVLERLPMRGGDELDATLGDRARCGSLKLGADLVDHDDLGHVVLDRLDHHRVLQQRSPDLHAASATDTRMWDVAVAAYLVRGVDDDDPLAQLVREKARALTQHRGLPDAGPAQQQDALTAHDDVADDLAGAGDRPADTHRQANDSARAVANGGDAMQRAFDAGPIVVAKLTDVVGHVVEVGRRDRMVRQQDLATWDARLWLAAEVQDDLQELSRIDALM